MQTLKPCPFCNSTDVSVNRMEKACMSWVSCKSCGLDTPSETGVTDEQATSYWNTRPAAPVEGLETVARYGQEDYVTRSQAEAIIAAKDARIDELEISLEKKTKEASSVWEDCEFDLRGGDYYACIYFKGQPEKDEIIQTSVITSHKDGSRTILAGVCNEGDRVLISENGIDAKGLMIINRDRYKRLEADNAALTARVKEQQDEIASLADSLDGSEHCRKALETQLTAAKEDAAQAAYRACAETRHVTLGEKAAAAVRAVLGGKP